MEAMAVESLVASSWKLDDFLVAIRHPVRVARGYSDIDVLGVQGGGAVRFAECKVRGPARRVNVEGSSRRWAERWDDSLDNVGRIWEARPGWLPLPHEVTVLEYQLVGNVWFSDDCVRRGTEARLAQALRDRLPASLRPKARATIESSFEVLTRVIRRVREKTVGDRWGRRFGDPLLDAVRELIRYAHPLPSGAKGARKSIQELTRTDLLAAVFGSDAESSNETA